MFRIVLLLFSFFVITSVNAQQVFTGKVVDVTDGNTLRVIDYDNDTINVILQGIDCPELLQENGTEAKAFTKEQCLGKEMTIQLLGRDRWGNDIANVKTAEGNDLSEMILKAGYAWFYNKNKGEEVFAKLEEDSRNQKLGIWQDAEPVAPWIFRRQQSMVSPKTNY